MSSTKYCLDLDPSFAKDAALRLLHNFLSFLFLLYQLSPITILYLSLITLFGAFNPKRYKYSIQHIAVWPPSICAASHYLGHQEDFLLDFIFDLSTSNPYLFAFLLLSILKLSKVIIHTISYYIPSYQAAAPRPQTPTLFPRDVTVVIPTIGELSKDPEFTRCVRSILDNFPAQIIISTVGPERKEFGELAAQNILVDIEAETGVQHHASKIIVVEMSEGNKRAQIMKAVEVTRTKIMAYADDHVFWPETYLASALAEFEDPHVGIVGTVKSVARERKPWAWDWQVVSDNLRNFFACIYLERHNFECTATYNLDGGVFVISGRTAFVRTEIFQSKGFREGHLNETWLGGWRGIGIRRHMKVDDDNYITRYMVNHGWKTVFRNTSDAVMDNTLGTHGGWGKFRGQLLRWARTTHRSNLTSLFWDGVCWTRYPWTTYAMFLQSFINIAFIFDTLLFVTLIKSGLGSTRNLWGLTVLLLATKVIKALNYYRRFPADLVLFPVQVAFGYAHGLVRLWALLTVKDIAWTGRPGIK